MTIDYFISVYFISAFFILFPVLIIKNIFRVIGRLK
jgi:hypothetical protein